MVVGSRCRGCRRHRGIVGWVVVVHTFDLNTWEEEAGDFCDFKVSLVYKSSSRIPRAVTLRKAVLGKNQPTNQPTKQTKPTKALAQKQTY